MLTIPLPLAKMNGSQNLLNKAILQKEVLKDIICSVSSDLIKNPPALSLMDKLWFIHLGNVRTAQHLENWHINLYYLCCFNENHDRIWPDYMAFPENEIRLRSYEKKLVTSEGFKDELEVWSSRYNPYARQLSSNHEEADTKLILLSIANNHKYIFVSSSYWCASFYYHTFTKLIAMNFGWMQELENKYTPRHDIAKSMYQDILETLLPFQTLTGYNTFSSIALH